MKSKIAACETHSENVEGLDIRVEIFSRPCPIANKRIITVCLVNCSNKVHGWSSDQSCLFQSFFKVSIVSPEGTKHIYPYPDSTAIGMTEESLQLSSDEEEESLALIYRKAKTFAVGHSCAANWESLEGTWQGQLTVNGHANKDISLAGIETVGWVRAESLPSIEIPSTTPNVERHDGTRVEVEMAPLSRVNTRK